MVAIYAKIVNLAGALVTKCLGLLAGLGGKLLSFEFVKKIVDVIKSVVDVIKKYVLNEKVVTIAKFILSIGLLVLTFVQVFLVGKDIVLDLLGEKLFFGGDVVTKLVFAACVVGLVLTLALAVKGLIGLIKKDFNVQFVSALLFTCAVNSLLKPFVVDEIAEKVIAQFTLVDVVAIVTVVYALATLLKAKGEGSFLGTFFSTIGAVVVFLIFKNVNLGWFLTYEIIGETTFSVKDVDLVAVLLGVNDLDQVMGFEYSILHWCLSLKDGMGAFASALALTLNVMAIIVGALLPFAILSLAVGFLCATVCDRYNQFILLSRVIYTLKMIFLFALVGAVSSFVISTWLGHGFMAVAMNVKGMITTLIFIIIISIIANIARKCVVSKPHNCIKTKKN